MLCEVYRYDSGLGPLAGYCESGYETASSIKYGDFIAWLTKYQFLEKCSVPWNRALSYVFFAIFCY
jgi:hypothetical protein